MLKGVPGAAYPTAQGICNGAQNDVDLRERLLRWGLIHAHRDGTFRSLPHVDLGSYPDGTPTADAKKNQAIFISRWFELRRDDNWPDETDTSSIFGLAFILETLGHCSERYVYRYGRRRASSNHALYPNGKPINELPYPRAKSHSQVPLHIRIMLASRRRRLQRK